MKCIAFSSLSPEDLQLQAVEMLRHTTPAWERNIWSFIMRWLDNSVKDIPVFTSGSTGKPKEIMHTKKAMLKSAEATAHALDLRSEQRALLCLPADKISGMMMLVRCMQFKLDMFYVRPSVHPLNEWEDERGFDFAAFTPMQLFDIVTDPTKRRRLEHIRKVIIGGEGIGSALLKILEQLSNELYATFGMTETISHIALKRLNGPEANTCYKTLEGIALSTDADSRLVIDAPGLHVHRLLTNDVVRLHSPGEFEWLGRVDNVINSGGVKLHPEVIEQKLEPFIKEPFFIGSVPDERSGEKVAIVLETALPGAVEIETLRAAFTVLSGTERPKVILSCPQFERTENNKVKRKDSLAQAVKMADV